MSPIQSCKFFMPPVIYDVAMEYANSIDDAASTTQVNLPTYQGLNFLLYVGVWDEMICSIL